MNIVTSIVSRAVLAALFLVVTSSAQGVVLSLAPSAATVTDGSSFSLDLVVANLAGGGAPSLSGFDLELTYDPSFLTATGVSFGDPVLGDQLDLDGFGPLTASDIAAAGIVSLAELSFDLPATLDALQPASFVLATIAFDAVMATPVGSPTTVGINPTPGGLLLPDLLIDSLASPLSVTALEDAEITIEAPAVTVAGSGTLNLALLGIVAMVLAARARGTS